MAALADGERQRPGEVQRLGLAADVLETSLKADRAAGGARSGGAADRVVAQQVLREAGDARVRPRDALGDGVEFGLLTDGHAEKAVGLALHAELGQVDRYVGGDRVRVRGAV